MRVCLTDSFYSYKLHVLYLNNRSPSNSALKRLVSSLKFRVSIRIKRFLGFLKSNHCLQTDNEVFTNVLCLETWLVDQICPSVTSLETPSKIVRRTSTPHSQMNEYRKCILLLSLLPKTIFQFSLGHK